MNAAVKVQSKPRSGETRGPSLDAATVRTVQALLSRLDHNPFAPLNEAVTPRELVAQFAIRHAITRALEELYRDQAHELAQAHG
jgi:hypothetical protein